MIKLTRKNTADNESTVLYLNEDHIVSLVPQRGGSHGSVIGTKDGGLYVVKESADAVLRLMDHG